MISHLAAFHGDVACVSKTHLERDLFDENPWCHALVAEASKDELVGYAILSPLIQLQFGRRGLDIHHLFVEEAHRGKGVGQLLLEASLQAANKLDCGYITVGTHPDNVKAQEFYLAAGFKRRSKEGPIFRVSLD